MQPQHHVQKRMDEHSMLRARERSGIWLENDIFLIKKTIQQYFFDGTKYSSNIILLYREMRNGTLSDKYHFIINWRGKYVWVVWNQLLQTTNTFMPLEALVDKLQFMPNSVVGFLLSRKLIDIDKLKKCEVIRVHPKTNSSNNRRDILKNDSYWDHNQPQSSK